MAVNEKCRLCETNLRIGGIVGNCKLLFDSKVVDNVASQLSKLGLIIENTPLRSYRVCRQCCTIISRLMRDTQVLQQWKDKETAKVVETSQEQDTVALEERQDTTASASADKGGGEPTTPPTDLPTPKKKSRVTAIRKGNRPRTLLPRTLQPYTQMPRKILPKKEGWKLCKENGKASDEGGEFLHTIKAASSIVARNAVACSELEGTLRNLDKTRRQILGKLWKEKKKEILKERRGKNDMEKEHYGLVKNARVARRKQKNPKRLSAVEDQQKKT